MVHLFARSFKPVVPGDVGLVTIHQSVMNVLLVVVSAMVNVDERGSQKVQLLAKPAYQYWQLKYGCHHQMKIHGQHREEVWLPLFYPPADPHRLMQPVLAWQLWPEYLAAGDSSTKYGESLMVLTGRWVSGGGGGIESVSSHPSRRASGAGRHAAALRRMKDV